MAHRSTKNVSDRMIVKFIRREMRDELYRRRGILAAKTSNGACSREGNQSTTSTRANKIRINESLTAYTEAAVRKN